MVKDLDDLADERTVDIHDPGEAFREEFLVGRPKPEWPPYIDESAKDLSAGILIGDTSLTSNSFGREVGGFYRKGLERATGRFTDLPEILDEHISDEDLGLLAYQLNELSYEISDTDIDDVQDATEAVLEKLLTRHAGDELELTFELHGSTVSHIATQLFEHQTVAEHVDVLLEEFEQSAGRGLLALMDEPQMMTPLWTHQREALEAWSDAGCRGYVDMATATGKTVLGLAALALRYGELHPADQGAFDEGSRADTTGTDDVLVVAHSELILEQWRREFDRHLNIPRERTGGDDDISLSWGNVHFRTPQALVNEEYVDYDLVLLDEAHHYATGSEWGSLLDAFEGSVLAMSGSVDDAGSDSQRIQERLTNSIGPELKRYTIAEARNDGIIPSFDWEVQYAPYDDESDLETASGRAADAFDSFRERVESGELDIPDDRRLRTFEDVRRFSHTTEGNELKQGDEQFRELVTRLFSRRTTRWNLSPSLDSIVDLVADEATTENVVVLADSNAQVKELGTRLEEALSESVPVYTVSKDQSKADQRETIDDFDEPEASGVLLGTGDLLGEGVDMQHASVAVNMATGGVNPELVQRIGRVLRNPGDTPKHAMFYNVVGVPSSSEAAVHREDGKRLLEEAAEFCSLGARFEMLPGFASEHLDDDLLGRLLADGATFVEELDTAGVYDWEDNDGDRRHLVALYEAVRAGDADANRILGQWEEYAWAHSEEPTEVEESDPDESVSDGDAAMGAGDDKEEPSPQPTESDNTDAGTTGVAGASTNEPLTAASAQETVDDGGDVTDESEPSIDDEPATEPATTDDDQSKEEPSDDDPSGGRSQQFFWDRDAEGADDIELETATVESEDDGAGRRDDLDKKIDEWKSQLLDLSRRNKLISFSPTKTKSLPFEQGDPSGRADALVEQERLYIHKRPDEDDDEGDEEEDEVDLDTDELLPKRDRDEAANSLANVELRQKQHLRERGVDSLYLSLGMLRWYSVDYSDELLRSPLFLAPVELKESTQRDGDRHDYVIEPKAEGLRLNPALRKKLAAERGLDLPADESLSLEQIDAAFEAVYRAIGGFDRWRIQDDVVLGIFDFAKFSLYTDLEENRELVKEDPIVQALTGDPEPLRSQEGLLEPPSAEELDDVVDPTDTFQVLDADSSQQEAIEAAKRGKSFVLQGPPGTGKSQTIANIVAEKLAAGETVLFVSEKQAALDVVKDRLDDVGVGRFCLEAHGQKANNADVLSSLESELKASPVRSSDERRERLGKLRVRRDAINEYGEKLFYSPPEWDRTVYQVFGIVEEHSDAPHVDLGIDDPLSFSQSEIESLVDELRALARYDREIDTSGSDPWRHTTLDRWSVDTKESMRRSLERQREVLTQFEEFAGDVEEAVGVAPATVGSHERVNELLHHLVERPSIPWRQRFFEAKFVDRADRMGEFAQLERERAELVGDLREHYERSFLSTDGAGLHDELAQYGLLKVVKPSYRSLRRRILGHATDGYSPGYDELLEDTRKLAEIQRLEDRRDEYTDVVETLGPLYEGDETDWETIEDAVEWIDGLERFDHQLTDPVVDRLLGGELEAVAELAERSDELIAAREDAARFFEDAVATDDLTVGGRPLHDAPLPEVIELLDHLENRLGALQSWVQFTSKLEELRETPCAGFVGRFLEAGHDAGDLVAAFERAYYTRWLGEVYGETGLDTFSVDELERHVEEFRALDREQLELARIEIQHRVTNRRPSLNLQHASSSEQVTVRREAEKERRHMPLRELFHEAGSFITQLTPCFMMSPLSVAQYLRTDAIEFDTVVFDEASQIMPQDAISSIVRADQAIIAGDSKQLPPTSFFQADVETTEDVREDLDSILEEAAAVLSEKRLRWHYRSRTEELIEFSNHHYYENSLRTFPENDPDVETGVSFEYVEDGIYDRGGSRQNEIEAQRVVDLVEEHAESHADKSLGVVAFSSAQETAIRDALEDRAEENDVLEAYVSQDDVLDEFFVKNLEMVQGDERDRMIFSVGYGPDQNGVVSMNFGPLNKTGGERRLNVAVTRARERVTVVSSLQPGEIDLTRTQSTGVEHFKNYLEYAKNGERALARDDSVSDTLAFDSRFEEAVYDTLEDHGYDVVSQVESSGYSIDLAIKHPDRPGEFVLGIECDGAAYHSSKTARDRDRTRQAVLEDLGWTIHRIWSPDWASNRERELHKIDEKVESLLDGASISTAATEVRSYEPETTTSQAKTDHEAIAAYEEPTLEAKSRYLDSGQNRAIKDSLKNIVANYGPIEREAAFQTALEIRAESRLGKKIRRIFESNLEDLVSSKRLVEHDEFLWPNVDDLEFEVRVNTDEASRTIDEIPLEELALAQAIVLREGGRMTVDDLELETARLLGYKRRGERIMDRIRDALEVLREEDLVSSDEQLSIDESADVRGALLARVYPSVSPDHGSDDDHTEAEIGANDDPQETAVEESIDESDGERSDDEVSAAESTGAESSSGGEVFPFLGFDDAERTAPCPYCREGVENTREAFVTHWIESDDCDGPESSPPASAVGPSLNNWDEIVDEVRSGRIKGYSGKATADESSEGHVEASELPIANPDGSNPWLAIHGEGRKVPCPFCGKWVFNSERAFRRHWRKSEMCSGPVDPRR